MNKEAHAFELNQYIGAQSTRKGKEDEFSDGDMKEFMEVCKEIDTSIEKFESKECQQEVALERKRKAIIGAPEQVNFYKNKIGEFILKLEIANTKYPPWYKNLEEAIFEETHGMCGISEWLKGNDEGLKKSSSAKIIGDNIYYLINGKQSIRKQKISQGRRNQLKTALLMDTPQKRLNDPYHEVYLNDGTRVTIFNEGMTKKGQDCIVFRKYIIPDYTFEQQAELGTIPYEAIPLFQSMIKVGFNVVFAGAVRTAKTTFLTTWQMYEDPSLEGVLIETDPEIPLHKLMPTVPIMQLVPDEEAYEQVIRNVMRSDADYIISAEARDGKVLNLAVDSANKGTRRSKMTMHITDIEHICEDITEKIIKEYGGDFQTTLMKVARSFHYVFGFVQLPDKSKKRLKAIWEVGYDYENRKPCLQQICKYNYESDDWSWIYHIGKDKEVIGEEEDYQAFLTFKELLQKLGESKSSGEADG